MGYDELKGRLGTMLKTAYMGCNRPVKGRRMQGAHIFVGYKDLEDVTTAVFIVRALEKRGRRLVRVTETIKKKKLVRK